MDNENSSREKEKESLSFKVSSILPPQKSELVTQIKQAAESLLYAWKLYPIQLPVSAFTQDAAEEVIDPKQLFIAPSFDELEEVAAQNPELTKEQLYRIKRRGEFDVPSKHFPGQFHKWRLGLFFGKGSERAYEALLCNCALALRLLIVTAKGRITSRFFSIKASFRNILLGLWQLIDILFGMPATQKVDINDKLAAEHRRYLVAELNIRKEDRQAFDALQSRIYDKYYGAEDTWDSSEPYKEPPPLKVPHVFVLPRGMTVDMRLYNHECLKAKSLLLTILERESKGWYIRFKDELVQKLQGQGLTIQQLSEKVEAAIRTEYFRRVFDAVENDLDLENIQARLGSLLVQQAKAHFIVANVNESLREKYQQQLEQRTRELKKSFPVRSKIQPWLRQQLDTFKKEFVARHRWVAHEKALEECQRQNLLQMVYFLQRDLVFRRDMEPVLSKEIPTIKMPKRTYEYSARIWLPRKWVITKTWSERRRPQQVEVIPTVVHDQLLANPQHADFTSNTYYSVSKNKTRTSDTLYFGWRCVNFVLRTWSWLFNIMFYTGIVIPLCSPVGLRALIGCHLFYPKYVVSKVDGELYRSPSSKTHTMTTKLNRLWRNVRHSREKFEGRPDTGFLNKDMARPCHKFWNYVLKGAVGSFLFVLCYPPTCVLICLLCFLLFATAFIWVPLGSLLAYLVSVIFYDFDHSTDKKCPIFYLFEALIYRILILGVFQFITAILTAFLLVPFASLCVLLFGVIRWLMRRTWDTFMFHAVVKRRGRVPASDTFVARRLSGPGMAANYFYQIRQEQVYAAVQMHMENEALDIWVEREKQAIHQPSEEFEHFIADCFGPFSAKSSGEGQLAIVKNRESEIEKKLSEAVSKRKKCLKIPIAHHLKSKIKISRQDLTMILMRTSQMVEKFYPDHIFAQMSADKVQQLWERRNLEQGDWKGLAAYILAQIFSSHFLTPLEDTDTCFTLEVDEFTLGEYMKRLINIDFPEDLDPVSTIHTPKESIDVEKPQIDVSSFFPSYGVSTNLVYFSQLTKPRRPWKTRRDKMDWCDTLYMPLPILHPVYICVLISERENEQNTLRLDTLQAGNYRFMMEGLENCQIAFADASTLPDTSILSQNTSVADTTFTSVALSPAAAATTSAAARDSGDDVFVAGTRVVDVPEIRLQILHGAEETPPAQIIYSESEQNNSCIISMSEGEEEESGVHSSSGGDWRLSAHTQANV